MPPLLAFSVKSVPNSSRVGVELLPFFPPFEPLNSDSGLERSLTSSSVKAFSSTPHAFKILTAAESLSRSSASSKCSVPTNEFLIPLAS